MIIGIGTDIVDIERIRKAMAKPRFMEEYFGVSERDFLMAKSNPAPSVANNFAAKEAFSKAIGTGVRGFSIAEVQTLRDELGKPYIELSGKAQEIAEKLGVKKIHVTLSNTADCAVAFVILEG